MRCPRCDRQLVSDDRFCSRCGLARCTDGKPVDPLIGIAVANRYRIDERIGVGGMGTVYRGTHIRLGQSVAIKVLHERYADDQKLTRRFEKEALTYGQVTHPNLVGLHDFGGTSTWCSRSAFAASSEQGRLNPCWQGHRSRRVWVRPSGIIHRLKPENIILMEHGLTLPRASSDPQARTALDAGWDGLGTPEYAPEQRGDRRCTE